jgi:hypothetical protein
MKLLALLLTLSLTACASDSTAPTCQQPPKDHRLIITQYDAAGHVTKADTVYFSTADSTCAHQ